MFSITVKFTALCYLIHRELAWSTDRVTGTYRIDALAARNYFSVLQLANVDMVVVIRCPAKGEK